jgi:hypothetical protein
MAKRSSNPADVSGWVGWVYFAAFIMVFVGFFQMLQGLTAILKDTYYVVLPEWIVKVDVTQWGWIHLVLGAIVFCAGLALFSGKAWGRVVGVVFAGLSMLANLLFFAAYPWWSAVIIVLDVLVIYALIVHGDEAAHLE